MLYTLTDKALTHTYTHVHTWIHTLTDKALSYKYTHIHTWIRTLTDKEIDTNMICTHRVLYKSSYKNQCGHILVFAR